jgi:polyphosphate kinase 2 (PPK2 family)
MKSINAFEALLEEQNNTHIIKFYLHISKEEQQERLNERLENPKKLWKYNEKDLQEAAYWDQYRIMYEEVFEHCSEKPWIIVPSDQNWYKEYIVASTVCNLLKELKLGYPTLPK